MIYRDLRKHAAWGKRFEPGLPVRTAEVLANAAGSVRPMKSLLRLACANALLRHSECGDPIDVNLALRVSLPVPDLEHLEPLGNT